MLVRTWMRPSAVRQAIVPCVSMCACWIFGSVVRALIDGIRLGQSPGHITGLGFDFLENVVRELLDP